MLWQASYDWERDYSDEGALWWADTEANRDLVRRAYALLADDPESALRLLGEAADAGSVWPLVTLGWHYDTGTDVPADFARVQDYYCRAVRAGSWMAQLRLARLHAARGQFDYCVTLLEDGVRLDFIPACYWLAHLRYKRSPTRKTFREIRPLLERAAQAGHPAAKVLLARSMMVGHMGLRKIPSGFRMVWKLAQQYSGHSDEAAPGPEVPSSAPALVLAAE